MNAGESQHTTSFWQVTRNSSHIFTTLQIKIPIDTRKRWYFIVLFCIIHTSIQSWIKCITVTPALEEIPSTYGLSQDANKWSGPLDETVLNEIPCHRMCSTKESLSANAVTLGITLRFNADVSLWMKNNQTGKIKKCTTKQSMNNPWFRKQAIVLNVTLLIN